MEILEDGIDQAATRTQASTDIICSKSDFSTPSSSNGVQAWRGKGEDRGWCRRNGASQVRSARKKKVESQEEKSRYQESQYRASQYQQDLEHQSSPFQRLEEQDIAEVQDQDQRPQEYSHYFHYLCGTRSNLPVFFFLSLSTNSFKRACVLLTATLLCSNRRLLSRLTPSSAQSTASILPVTIACILPHSPTAISSQGFNLLILHSISQIDCAICCPIRFWYFRCLLSACCKKDSYSIYCCISSSHG
ncbi:hypothetical protein LXL04_028180 [Taraxacum kok-saghyz]